MKQELAVRPIQFQGLQPFGIIWFGQVISMIGSGLTTFALSVWAYEQSNSTTLFALMLLASTLPSIVVSPIAGVLVDRWNRRHVLIISDVASAIVTLTVAALLWISQLNIWHIYLAVALSAIIKAFQLPAYTVTTALLIPKQHYSRASGMLQFGAAVTQVIAPFLAGFLIQKIQLGGIILIDVFTFLIAVSTLLIIEIPNPQRSDNCVTKKNSLLFDASYGLSYITTRRGLVGVLIFFAIINFALGISQVLFTPLALKIASPAALGTVVSAGGLGMLVGTILLSTWGGPHHRMQGVVGFGVLFGLGFILAGIYPSILLVSLASFSTMFAVPFINGCSQAIWQVKVAPEVQGRVFATRMMIAWACTSLAFSIAGPLADKLFEPSLMQGGILESTVGYIIGSGPGRGIGLMFVITGVLAILASVSAYLYRPLWRLEEELPDAIP